MKSFLLEWLMKILFILLWLGLLLTSPSPKFQLKTSTPIHTADQSFNNFWRGGISTLSKPLVWVMPLNHSPIEQKPEATPQQLRRSGRTSRKLNFEARQAILAQEMGMDQDSGPDWEEENESQKNSPPPLKGTPIPRNHNVKGTPIPTPSKPTTSAPSTIAKKTQKFMKNARKSKWKVKMSGQLCDTPLKTPSKTSWIQEDDQITISKRELEKLVDARVAARTKNNNINFNYERHHGISTLIARTKPGYKTLARTDDDDCFVPRIFDPIRRNFEELKKLTGRNNRLLDLGLEHAKLSPHYIDEKLEMARTKCLMEEPAEELILDMDSIIMVKAALGAFADSIMLRQELHAHREETPATTVEQLRRDNQVLHETMGWDKKVWKCMAMATTSDAINPDIREKQVALSISKFARIGARAQGCEYGVTDFELAGDAPLERFQTLKPKKARNGRNGGGGNYKNKKKAKFDNAQRS